MRITDFNRKVTRLEGNRVNLTIAQVSEVSKVINILTVGCFIS